MAIADSKEVQGSLANQNGSSTTIIVGAGPVGYRCALELCSMCADMNVILFSDEPCKPYNRIQLSSLLAGEISSNEIFTPIPLEGSSARVRFIQRKITIIDTEEKYVKDSENTHYHFDSLVLATGSSPRKLDVQGSSLSGVFTFRNLQDTEVLTKRVSNSKHCVVVGGGLLGLEVARGMKRDNNQVTVIQQADRLMERQLDTQAAMSLQSRIKSCGIDVVTGATVKKVIGVASVKGVEIENGKVINCDTLIVCAGITPNLQLAETAGLLVNKGIVVNSQLETSVPGIFAVGECSEYNGMLNGLVAPGLEQVKVLSKNLAGMNSIYEPLSSFTQLKILNEFVASLGDVNNLSGEKDIRVLHYMNKKAGICRTLNLKDKKLIALCCVGEWSELQEIRGRYDTGLELSPWQRIRFYFSGELGVNNTTADLKAVGDNTIICQCLHVDKGRIVEAANNGAKTIESVGCTTGAGTICGSCLPQIQTLISTKTDHGFLLPDVIGQKWIWRSALVASLIAITALVLPGIPHSLSVQHIQYDWLWKNDLAKQISGFSLLGIIALTLMVSLRKRMQWTFLGSYDKLRVVHTVLGFFAILVLLAHTGAHLGNNLNKFLMINFLLVIIVGAIAGLALVLSNKLEKGPSLKKIGFWAHIIVAWPLPVLLGAHILTVYYF